MKGKIMEVAGKRSDNPKLDAEGNVQEEIDRVEEVPGK
jgi:uncharacterized protein YjbJ (UPF0337 family)